jgi:DNA helicase MCM8
MRVPEAKIQNTWVQFDCTACNGSQLVMQPDGLYTLPRLCLTKTCKAKSAFVARFRSRFTQMVQKIRLQEMLAAMSDSDFASKKATFSTPPIIDVELKQELVGSVEPGDDITVTAILKARADPTSRSNQATGCLKIYLEAVSVVTNSNKKTRCVEECTPNDLKMFQTVHTEPMGVFRFLVHSLCPEIYGHEMVKAGLLLALFGGASIKEDDDLRTEVHVLVVGDPGMGKSRMLQACVSAAPRGEQPLNPGPEHFVNNTLQKVRHSLRGSLRGFDFEKHVKSLKRNPH